MDQRATDKMGTTMTDNFVEVKHSYFSPPDDEGVRLKSTDTWYAVRPSPPVYSLVDYTDKAIPDSPTSAAVTGWSLHKAGLSQVYIFDRDDIRGLRVLLDALDAEFDRKDLESLMDDFSEDEDSDDD